MMREWKICKALIDTPQKSQKNFGDFKNCFLRGEKMNAGKEEIYSEFVAF
jgi:hypothetical protein